MIELRNVCKSYNKGSIRAVDDLTLAVPPGEIFGFLGPNGAGKTTTIKMIVGILAPDSGTIAVEGRDNRKETLACKKVTAYVPDEPEIYERLTGLEYLNFIADVYGVPAGVRAERAGRWLEKFELSAAVAEKFCDRIAIIHKGRLIACGSLDELRRQAGESQSLENIFLELTEP
ncbi:MAG: ABC transporter ATP-binding protein [Candidatus Aminicenantes bacterium]|nr:ABC transporter ATP-binding protein [Candidatus Aminicenantes bacterium]